MAFATPPPQLIPPYGGRLVDLLVSPTEATQLHAYAASLPSLKISPRAECDLELLATGAFSPLDRFMGEADYRRVLDDMRLADGRLFPIPVTLPVEPAPHIQIGRDIALRAANNDLLAIMTIAEMYEWDRDEEAQKVYGSLDLRHPLVAEMHRWGTINISGPLRVLRLPAHYDFKDLRLTPTQVRSRLETYGHPNVVAFQTRNPLHRVHEELTKRAIDEVDGILLLHPVVGLTKPGDVDHYTRVRTYMALAQNHYDPDRILLALLPLAMRMGGPREALWHAIIRRNYGANHLIVGRDHAGPGNDSTGKPFYGPYDAQDLVSQFSDELGVSMVPFRMLVYLPDEDRYEEEDKIAKDTRVANISGTQVRDNYLAAGKKLPDWFTRPQVADILAEAYPPTHRQGFCVWFTGLSGSGKSATANILTELLLEHGRQVTVLDGNVVRTTLSEGLGYDKHDRDVNVRRMGFVASEIVRHGGAVICAAVSPYRATRNDVRAMVGKEGYIEVFVDTPLAICEQRDAQGMYAGARSGEIKGFTGIDDPYEPPQHPEIHLDGAIQTPEANARAVFQHLLDRGLVRPLSQQISANGA